MKRFGHCLFTLLVLCATAGGALAVPAEIPPSSLKVPDLLPETSISTHIPSEAAPGQGLAVSLIYPEKPRYKDGAPVVVVVPAGHAASGLDFSMHAPQAGFVEVRFAFPGGGKPGLLSGGIYDNRGTQSQLALRDILSFAAGKTADLQGRTINELVPVKVYNNQIGIAGWSNGGNIAAVTLGKFAPELQFVGWAAFYETPLGALFYPANLGGPADLNLNRHYREGSSATGKVLVDYRKLEWQKDGQKTPGQHKKVGEPEVRGVLFFDENKNGRWEESFEYAFSYATDVGLDKQIYPPEVTAAAERLHVFDSSKPAYKPKRKPPRPPAPKPGLIGRLRGPSKADIEREEIAKKEKEERALEIKRKQQEHYWPDAVATVAESEAFYMERDGSLYIKEICEKLPNCMIEIFGSRVDHMQRQPDHPHLTLQYNTWLANKAKWVRFNPDPFYVAQMSEMNRGNFVDNKPNESIDANAIDAHLEPEGMVPDYLFMDAAIAELSDRRKANKPGPLTAPIVTYEYGAPPPFDPNNFRTPAKPKAASSASKPDPKKAAK
jgi:hypothetical protein